MKKKQFLLPLLMMLLMMAMSVQKMWAQGASFMVMSDMHVMSKSLFDDGTAFTTYAASEPKLVENSQDVFDAAIAKVKTAKPAFLLVAGDLTKDGEKVSHEYVAAKLKELVALGIKVYVVPGNHDIGNPNAKSYLGSTPAKVASITADEWKSADFYQSCGYSDAVMSSGLSYMVYPADGIALIALDSRKPDTETTHYSEGGLTEETLAWAETAAAKASSDGRVIIGMMHHPIMEHFDGHKDIGPTYLTNQTEGYPVLEGVQQRLVAAGIGTMFTGHFHLQSIQYEETTAGRLYDVMTGSLSSYPMAMRSGTIAKNGNISVAPITDVASSELLAKALLRNKITTQGVLSVLANKMVAKISALKASNSNYAYLLEGVPSSQSEIMTLLNTHMRDSYEVLMNSLALGDENKDNPDTKITACINAYDAFLAALFTNVNPLIKNSYPALMSDYTAQNTAMVTSVFQNTKGTGSVVADNTNNSLKTIPSWTINAATWKTVLAEINNARVEYSDPYTITFADSYSGSDEGTSVGTGIKLYGGENSNYNYVVAPTTAGNVIMAPADCSELFKDLSNLTSVTFDNFNIENATNLSSMITDCKKLEHIYVHCNKVATYKAALSSYASIISGGVHYYPNGFCACGDIESATPVYKEDGTTIDHYNIGNAGQLLWFSNFVNAKEGDNYPNVKANAKLTADIVVNDGEFDDDGTFTPLGETEGATPISITPIGTIVDNAYEGTFDGDGHTISGLYFAGGESNCYVGLFGFLYTGSVVKRLGLTNVYYSGSYKSCELGAIAGLNKGTIENCYSIGVLKNAGTGSPHTGGICGRHNGTIKNCYTTITSFVYGDDNSDGGITNCYVLTTYGNTQAANFASGEICYLLNGSRSEGTAESPLAWYQNLSAEGGDSYPVLKAASDGSNTVYYGYDNGCETRIYTNDVSKAAPVHDFTKKTLSATADEGTGLYSYVCDKCGEKNADVKVIKDYAPKAEGNAKNLELTVTTNGETTTYSTTEIIALTDDNQFASVNVAFSTTQAPTYTREMSTEWGTIVMPFEVSTQTDDYDLYKCEALLDGRLVMRILPANEAVPAGYPAFVRKKTTAESVTFTATGNAEGTIYAVNTADRSTPSIGTAMALCGTYAALPKTSSNTGTYFIYNDKFWNVSELSDGQTVTILPFHAYIQEAISEEGPGNMNAKLVIVVAGDATGINANVNDNDNMAGAVFNLNGQRLSAPQKGVNIINGKKVLVK